MSVVRVDLITDKLGDNGVSVERIKSSLDGLDSKVTSLSQMYANLGYDEITTPYGPGINFTSYNQIIEVDGEFWQLDINTTLPYVTTGVGMPELGVFLEVSGASLRNNGIDFIKYDGAGLKTFLDSLSTDLGASRIGLFRENGLTGRTVEDFARETLSINDFFIPGQSDWTEALQSARDFLAGFPGKPPALEFESGKIYEASVMPNWAIKNIVLRGNNATLRNTGTGDNLIIDSGESVSLTFFVNITGFFLEGGPSSGHGVFVRSVHHSHIQAEVRGCGTNKNALQVNFAVCSRFNVDASVNRGAWYMGGKPQRGIVLEARNGLEAVTACTFMNPIIEGMDAQGILLTNADVCRFIGGTSEANGGANVECSFESRFNVFDQIDLEVTAIGQGFIDRGRQNTWLNIYNDANCTITSTAIGCRIVGGIVDAISNSSASTDLDGVRYGIAGGVITNIGGVAPRMRNVYSIGSAVFIPDQLFELKIGSGGSTIKKHLSSAIVTGAWGVPTSVPGISKKDSISFPGVALGDTIVVGCSSVIPEGYTLIAVVTAPDTVSLRLYQLYGTAASPFPSGATFRLDAWGH